MRKTINIIFACLIVVGSTAIGQTLPAYYDTLQRGQEIVLEGGIDYYASSVQREVTSKFISGGLITEEMKDNSFNKHRAINRMGAVYGSELEYINYNKKIFKKKDWGFVVKAGYHGFAGILYSKDLYGLVMYGNERYIGETMDFSGTDLTYMNYQKVGFGLIDNKTKSSVSLNVYNVSDHFSGDFRTMKITQDESGDQITMEMDADIMLKNNLKFNQGIGLGLDLDFKVPIAWGKEREAYIRFQAQNIGFAYMYEPQKYYSIDTTIVFSGLKFDDLIGDNALLSDSTFNVLDTVGVRVSEKNKTLMIPGFLQIGKIVDEHYEGKLQSFFGVRLYPSLIYSPYVFAGLDYHPAQWIRMGISASYGGFGKFRGGLYTDFRFGKSSIGLSSENIVGFFTQKSSGQSLFLRFRCGF